MIRICSIPSPYSLQLPPFFLLDKKISSVVHSFTGLAFGVTLQLFRGACLIDIVSLTGGSSVKKFLGS